MYSIQEYHLAQSLEEAAQLLAKSRRNRIIGGGMWMRLGNLRIGTAIDLSRLGLDTVREENDVLVMGAMVSLRQLETDPLVQKACGGVLSRCVRDIVGTQFRSTATVGGSVFGRYGFSDLDCTLLALDARVVLYRGGEVPLESFMKQVPARDIITEVRIPIRGKKAVFQSLRQTRTDFPVLNLCLCRGADGKYALAIGARPGRALRCREAEACIERGELENVKRAVRNLPYGSNMRGSAAYRRAMADVLVRRALEEMNS